MRATARRTNRGDLVARTSRQSGFTYIAVLVLIAVMGLGTASFATIWSTTAQRDKERELLFVGNQFRRAIAQYYEQSPGVVKQYPRRLEDLLEDNRFVGRQRHLRRLYVDPMTGRVDWGLVRAPDGGIAGVYSLSEKKAIKTAQFRERDFAFAGKSKYREWEFSYTPPVTAPRRP